MNGVPIPSLCCLRYLLFRLQAETNYSGFRDAIDQARQRWREVQSWMMGSFHRPVYQWKVRQWAVTDSTLRRTPPRGEKPSQLRGWALTTSSTCAAALGRTKDVAMARRTVRPHFALS